MTLTPMVMAMATPSEAMVTEFRVRARDRLAAASSVSIARFSPMRAKAAQPSPYPFAEMKRDARDEEGEPGQNEKGRRRKPASAGRWKARESEKTPAKRIESNPLISQAGDGRIGALQAIAPMQRLDRILFRGRLRGEPGGDNDRSHADDPGNGEGRGSQRRRP